MGKRSLGIILALIMLIGVIYYDSQTLNTGISREEPKVVITFGADLTEAQKSQLMKTFEKWKKRKNAHIIKVSNQEERQYLEGKIEENLIGTRAISSAYLELMDGTEGIEIETENITAITPFMYVNALTTAGVEDARVIVAAPFEVSGTAALTGIIKAFETARAEKLPNNAKETAYQELTETYKLSHKYGKKNTENMIYDIKREVIEKDLVSTTEIKAVIIEISNHYNINLNESEIERIILLMQGYKNIKLDTGKIEEQLKNVTRNLAEVQGVTNITARFLEQIANFFKNLALQLENILKK